MGVTITAMRAHSFVKVSGDVGAFLEFDTRFGPDAEQCVGLSDGTLLVFSMSQPLSVFKCGSAKVTVDGDVATVEGAIEWAIAAGGQSYTTESTASHKLESDAAQADDFEED